MPCTPRLREYGGNEPSIFYRRWHYGRRAGRNDVRAVRPALGRGSLLRLRRAGGRVYLRAGRLTPAHLGSAGGKTRIIQSVGCVPRTVPPLRLSKILGGSGKRSLRSLPMVLPIRHRQGLRKACGHAAATRHSSNRKSRCSATPASLNSWVGAMPTLA